MRAGADIHEGSKDRPLKPKKLLSLKEIFAKSTPSNLDLTVVISQLGNRDEEIRLAAVEFLKGYAARSIPILQSKLQDANYTDCEKSVLQNAILELTNSFSCGRQAVSELGNEAKGMEWSPAMFQLNVQSSPLVSARKRFDSDLPDLLTHSRGKWVAYSDDGPLSIPPDYDPEAIFAACRSLGYPQDSFVVCHIRLPETSGIEELVTCD